MSHHTDEGTSGAAHTSQSPRYHSQDCPSDRHLIPVEELCASYELDTTKELGRGAHGCVVRALNKDTNRLCAIKKRSKKGLDATHLRYNRIEGQMLVNVLDHENIVKAYEYFETGSSAHLVLELAELGDLLDLVNKRAGVSELEASLITLQLISGLQAAHDRGVVHGDLKLENVRCFSLALARR